MRWVRIKPSFSGVVNIFLVSMGYIWIVYFLVAIARYRSYTSYEQKRVVLKIKCRLLPIGADRCRGCMDEPVGESMAESTIWCMRWNQKVARVERWRGRVSERQR